MVCTAWSSFEGRWDKDLQDKHIPHRDGVSITDLGWLPGPQGFWQGLLRS